MLQQAQAKLAAATARLTSAKADLIRNKAVLVHNEMEWVTAVADQTTLTPTPQQLHVHHAEPVPEEDQEQTALTYSQLVDRSAQFQKNLGKDAPTEHNRLSAITDAKSQQLAAEMAAEVRPVLMDRVLTLMEEWLAVKREHGSTIERNLYASGNIDTPTKLVDRLLQKRFVALVGAADQWLLPNGLGGAEGIELVGTDQENRGSLRLAEVLSYDELALSALVGLSCPTRFINAGARDNRAVAGEPDSFEEDGVYVGLVGARFERHGRMEWAHMIVTPTQNTTENGYGSSATTERAYLLRAWAHFYGLAALPTYAEAKDDTSRRFHLLEKGNYLDLQVYRARMRISAETLLSEAQARGEAAGRPAYVHAVGLGLGEWQVDPVQVKASLQAYRDVLEAGPGNPMMQWTHVAVLDFSWFGDAYSNGVFAPGDVVNGVAVRFSKRDPAAKLTDNTQLLVASYAWDGGALPGNEYWWGQLTQSGDPAAACCSWIGELGNPHVNPSASSRTLVVFGASLSKKEVTAYLSDTSKCCILPVSQGTVNASSFGSTACTTISLLACEAFVNNELNIGVPCHSTEKVLTDLMTTGNTVAPEARFQDPFEAQDHAKGHFKGHFDRAAIVGDFVTGTHLVLMSTCYTNKEYIHQPPERWFPNVLRSLATASERTAATLTAQGKTISLMGGHNHSFAIFDSHSYEKYVQPGGAAWITGTVYDAETVATIIMYILTADNRESRMQNDSTCFATMSYVQKKQQEA